MEPQEPFLPINGQTFYPPSCEDFTRKFNIQHFKTTAYHPQSNNFMERSHQVITEYLKTQIDKEGNWDLYIKLAMFSYNTSVHEGTQYSPYELVFGRIVRLSSAHPPIEENVELTYPDYLTNLFNKLSQLQHKAREKLIKSKERSKYYYDRTTNRQGFGIGTYVFLLKEPQRGKLSAQYAGPYQILKVLDHNNVKILIDNQPRTVHTDKLKIAHIDPG
jgi:hypothetical protein